MKIKGMIKALVCAFGLVTASSAMAGDIYEILPCDQSGTTIDVPASMATPLQSGETVYFKIRFAKRHIEDASSKPWSLAYVGVGEEFIDNVMFPLQIGVYASGKSSGMPDYADLIDVKSTNNGKVTDFIFAYKTKVGDFALPIVLAVNDNGTIRPANESEESVSYYLNRTDKWAITNGDETEPINMTFRAPDKWVGTLDSASLSGQRANDYSLSQCGFYVKTVDFDDNWENKATGTELWRSVHQNSTITIGATPQITALAPLGDAVTMYVWSTDDSAVTIAGGVETEMITGYVGGVPQRATFKVGKITLAGGRTAADFSIYGVTEMRTAKLVLSTRPAYRYQAGTKERFVDYIEVPVKCVEPQPASVVVEADRTTCYANGNYMVYAARLSVSATQPSEIPLEVTLTPKFEDDKDKTNWADYVRFSTTSDTVGTLPSGDNPPKVTIPAGSTEKKSVWVFALRADSHTVGDGHQLQLFPSITPEAEAASGIHDFVPTGLWISAEKPVIVTPDVTSEYSVTASEKLEINVAVDDTYADKTDVATGYKVQIKTGSTASWTTLDENFKASGEGGELVGITSGKAPEITYPIAGDQKSQIRVVAPVSGKTSEIVTFTVHVAAAKTTRAYTTDDKDDTYIEGDLVHYGIELSAPNDTNKPIYAFLLCNEDVDLGQFGGTAASSIILSTETAAPKSKGVQISSVGQSATSSFTVLDGIAEDDGGQNYTFQVVLCDQKTYDPDHRLKGYPTTEMLNITVYNKAPVIDDLQVNGFETEGGSGSTLATQYPKGQPQSFQPVVTDVSFDLKHGFNYKWTATRNGQGVANGVVRHDVPVAEGGVATITTSVSGSTTTTLVPDGVDINTVPFAYTFPMAGDWTVKVQVMDKDMGGKYAPLAYSVNLKVIDNPQVVLEVEESYQESDNKASIRVGLGYWDGNKMSEVGAPSALVVKVTTTPPAGANAGLLTLDSEYKKVPAGYPALEANEYYVVFNQAVTQDLHIDVMDGTPLTSSKGFTVKAEVVTGGPSTDPSQEWKDYYLANQAKVYIENEMPVTVVTEPNESTNAWQVAGGAATSYPIRWQIRKDVNADFTTTWEHGEGPGIKVEFAGCDNAEVKYITDTDVWSGSFVPNFGSAQNKQTVTLTIEDKDGDYQTWTYTYEIVSSKFLLTTSTGPSGGMTTSALSQRYAKADGRGAGHTFVSGATYAGAEAFTRSWNCQRENSMLIYGFGYKWGAIDNGALNTGLNVAVDTQGNNPSAVKTLADDAAYVYNPIDIDDEGNEFMRDSYFYCWLLTAPTEKNAQTETTVLGSTAAPEVGANPAKGTVDLPQEALQDGSYAKTYLEAIFSKEWLPEDNVGDINFDGVPDVFAFRTWRGGNLIDLVTGSTDDETRMANDMADLAQSNPDEDYFPGVLAAGDITPLVPNSGNSYAPIGIPLTTIRELRGWDEEGLNARDLEIVSDIKFSDDEKSAWAAYAKDHGLVDPETPDVIPEPNLAIWSPEPGTVKFPRMDPTLADTDGDGFDDGWEYYFWYAAKVLVHHVRPAGISDEEEAKLGYKKRDGQLFAFEKFAPRTLGILEGEEIPAEEVIEFFDPCNPRTAEQIKKRPDFDNDGLADIEEYLLGTNPTHWDTDGDHLCDAWEVMMCLDPLNGSKGGNPDGDFMARLSTLNCTAFRTAGEEGQVVQAFAIDATHQLVEGLDIRSNWNIDPDTGMTYLEGGVALRDVTFKAIVCSTFEDPRHPGLDGEGAPYMYGTFGDKPEKYWNVPDQVYGYWMAKEYRMEEVTFPAGTEFTHAEFVFIHDQIFDLFGFDPRTGWCSVDGFVQPRWNPSVNKTLSPLDTTGVAVNTAPYANYDEYLLMRYRLDFGKMYADQIIDLEKIGIWDMIRGMTTNPNIVAAQEAPEDEEETEEGEEEEEDELVDEKGPSEAYYISKEVAKAFAAAGSNKAPVIGHGADTDGDGVPDGWELYMFRSPNVPPAQAENPTVPVLGTLIPGDNDDDGLVWSAEYAGTDSCNAYQGCASIYRNHPGNNEGWFNKFFPTDPGVAIGKDGRATAGADTDGDGILDSLERGASVITAFREADGTMTPCIVSVIYGREGNRATDDGTCCIRGGGLNPCTVDTDIDGLPDPWELKYLGATVNPSTKQSVNVTDLDGNPLQLEVGDDRWTADGVLAGGPDVVYITGGMDPTWSGDAYTDPGAKDALLGEEIVRDVDWDHDGLQNWQEYMVQTVRHFRYDDITTPLMGRTIKEWGAGATHQQDFAGFLPMMQDAEEFAVNAVRAWEGQEFLVEKVTTNNISIVENQYSHQMITNYTVTVTTNIVDSETWVNGFRRPSNFLYFSQPWSAAGWKALGYMSAPAHAWDRMITCAVIQPSLLFPVSGCGDYVGTSPLSWDTDGDGMDDYYEMFHGLNPLLGDTQDLTTDVIAIAWGQPTFFNAAWNEWTHPDFNRSRALMRQPGSALPPMRAPALLDPVLYPWVMGAMDVDADGDGIRNTEEALLANVASPSPTHTDPTPLWFTDTSSAKSYVSQYYPLSLPTTKLPFWPLPAAFDRYASAALMGAYASGYAYAFEENEGYDTDNDWLADGTESAGSAVKKADPLDFSDPNRRQAMYFDGVDSFMMTSETQMKAADGEAMLKQFTVECWFKPEALGRTQTIIERSSFYNGDKINDLAGAVRANFRIGLDEAGRVYGLFDSSECVESATSDSSTAKVMGSVVEPNVWTHVALTYNGNRLAIYVNGAEVGVKQNVSLIPANGVIQVLQDIASESGFPQAAYKGAPSALFIGARPQHFDGAANVARRMVPLSPYYPANKPYVIGQAHDESFDNYREYFQGWVDEVRIWDGARSEKEIAANYRKRLSFKDVAELREDNFTKWNDGWTRNDKDGRPMLPAELIAHYSFCNMPGGMAPEYVAKTPTGFRKFVLGGASALYEDNADNTGALYDITGLKGIPGEIGLVDGVDIGWWKDCLTHSSVYTDYSVIPWAENTVAHLPILDGSCWDSFYYGENIAAGYTLPTIHTNLTAFTFPNGANPYRDYGYGLERYITLFERMHFAEQVPTETVSNIYNRYEYELHGRFLGNSDLLPMGGAYARTTSEYWDGHATDTWELSSDDSGHEDDDCDGLPDWWEDLVRDELGDALDWNTTVTYLGVQMTAGQAFQIMIAQGLQPDGEFHDELAATVDDDHNGLLDWWETLFNVVGGANGDPDGDGLSNYAEYLLSMVFDLGQLFDPNNSHSVDPQELDYFFPIGSLYVGEIFTDHDMINDAWEDDLSDEIANRYRWDMLTDGDENGWTAWDEACASFDKETWVPYGTETNIVQRSFEGKTDLGYGEWVMWWQTNAAVIVTGNLVDQNGWKWTGSYDITPERGATVDYTLYEEVPVLAFSGRPKPLLKAKFWYNGKQSVAQKDGEGGAQTAGGGDEKAVTYAPIIVMTFTKDDLVIPDATFMTTPKESLNAGPLNIEFFEPVSGYIKGGRNTIVAFCDTNGDGVFTPREPFAMVRDVEIGWHQGAFQMELTDVSPVLPRAAFASVADSATGDVNEATVTSDRHILYGTEDGDWHQLTPGSLSGGVYERIRVIRTAVNGENIMDYGITNNIVADRWINIEERPFFFEGDVMAADELDLDWATLESSVVKKLPRMDITNVTYRIVLGNGTTDSNATNNLFSVAPNRHFDSNATRPKPTTVAPGSVQAICYGTRPTFKWSMGEANSYTAFKVQVLTTSGATVWDSGVRAAPARDSDLNYTFVPDVYVGDLLKAGQNYKWRVSMYNAKFRSDLWSDEPTFRIEPAGTDKGAVDVCVKYFGPSLAMGTLRVEAYETPDFSGAPVARTTVTDLSDVAVFGTQHAVNARLIGLSKKGTYYVCAYLDAKAYGTAYARDAWEPWGYACPRHLDREAPYQPEPVVGEDMDTGRLITVYVEDVDLNGNALPDGYEMVANGGKLDSGTERVTTSLGSGIAVSDKLSKLTESEAFGNSTLNKLLASTFANAGIAELALGVKVQPGETLSEAIANGTKVVDGSVSITGAAFDPATKTVTLTVEADVTNPYAKTAGAALYTFTADKANVTCKVLRKTSLVQADWEVVATTDVTVGREAAEVTAALEGIDVGSGFFKVELVK